MTDKNEEYNFDDLEGDINEMSIAFTMLAELAVPMFLSLRKKGLSVQEAAAMTAAFFSQQMPMIPQGPQEGS